MKRLFAIILLSVHLFNLGGYALFYQYFIHRADVQMVKEVYNDKINDSRFIELKIPVHMPTITDWTEYEVVAGQVQLKNAYYNYVKLKMTRDTMYFICLPNTAKTRLVAANIITAKEISDVPMSKKGEQGMKKLSTSDEYSLPVFKYHYAAFETLIKPCCKNVFLGLHNPYIESPGKPPNFIS
ncbi:hypothetical protein [uncultured Mucilaginibacter sp.]|uniref:hypothetical protein n=1 Tax=uncultured Mucilaginibacter sp. TaxID=797541 RepID=UPI0025D0A837|nr:hypothetical protein [uncultured Mucilaginibacter sp.]